MAIGHDPEVRSIASFCSALANLQSRTLPHRQQLSVFISMNRISAIHPTTAT